MQIGTDTDWDQIAAGYFYTIALKTDGSLWAWGNNDNGELGDGTTTEQHSPVQIGTDTNWTQIVAGAEHTIALKTDGSLWTWGFNMHGQLGDGTTTSRSSPVQIIQTGTNIARNQIAAGGYHTIALRSNGSLWAWGFNTLGQLGDGTTINRHSPVQIGSDTDWAQTVAGVLHTIALKNDCSLWAWGDNRYGQLGDGTTVDRYFPVQTGTDTDWAQIAGSAHTIALKSDGSLWAWGHNNFGQLGNGTTIDRHSPVQIGTDTNWARISAGFFHTIALKSDGSLWTWGRNSYGQLGDETTINRHSPVQIGTDTDWSQIAAGYEHTIALKTDGSLWAWGSNSHGQLGDGTTTDRHSPVQTGTDTTDWAEISARLAHTIALKSDGSLWAWGCNVDGRLGDGTTTDRHSPVQIGTDIDWAQIAAGEYHTIALKTDGSLVVTNIDWNQIASGTCHTMALESDGALWAWGSNDYGQLGDGTTTDRHSPVEVQIGNAYLYFPHIDSAGTWETEICAINTSDSQTLNGTFKAYNDSGTHVSEDIAVTLAPHGRREITVGDEFPSPADIGYIVFESDSDAVVGYTKFYIEGKYRVAVPAVSEINTNDIYISHIASYSSWWTGISLLNTTSSPKDLTIEFDNGTTKTKTLEAYEHSAFMIKDLFDGQSQPDINSAVIKDGSGVIGLELFGSGNQLSGILLKDDTTTKIYYPHVASDATWWTGIVAYNPSDTPCNITITPYTAAGVSLATTVVSIAGKEKYIGLVADLGLPGNTAWFQIDAASPITGFELFGTWNENQLGGYTGVGISGKEGAFAKLEKEGWTGIAFVNTGASTASILLTAYDDTGTVITTETIGLDGHAKRVDFALDLFAQNISSATYITYSSDLDVVGFQLNGSTDNMMLDGLPGM